jgi:hypothetical protein
LLKTSQFEEITGIGYEFPVLSIHDRYAKSRESPRKRVTTSIKPQSIGGTGMKP